MFFPYFLTQTIAIMRPQTTPFFSGSFAYFNLRYRRAFFVTLLLGALVSTGCLLAVAQPMDVALEESYSTVLAPCSDPTISFFIEKDLSTGCPAVRVGLRSSEPGKVLRLRRMEFDLSFAMSADIPFAKVVFQNWPDLPCATVGCAGGGECWRFDAATRRFSFCFSGADAVEFALDAEPRILLVFKAFPRCLLRPGLLRIETDLELDSGQIETCTPPLASNEMFRVCANDLRVRLTTLRGGTLSDAYLQVASTNPCVNACVADSIPVEQGFCDVCPECDWIRIRPFKNDDHANGVGTYDIVLLNRHITGQKPLKSLYHLMAADINGDYVINGADIVALRSLILGMSTALPQESWRFVDPANIVYYPLNPLLSQLPDHIISPNPPVNPPIFMAIKIGDVSGNAVVHLTDDPADDRSDKRLELPVSIGYAEASYRKGQIFSVPVTYQGDRPLLAYQMALRFDAQRMALKGMFAGDLPGYDDSNFGLTRAHEGEIRTFWIAPGDKAAAAFSLATPVLFYLTFEALTDMAASEGWIGLSHDLACRLWDDQEEEYEMTLTAPRERTEEGIAASALQVAVRPNPVASDAQVALRVPDAMDIQLAVWSADGRLVLERRWSSLAAGEHVLHLPETARLPTGIYAIEVVGSRERCIERFLKH
jgi:hypothetical protein